MWQLNTLNTMGQTHYGHRPDGKRTGGGALMGALLLVTCVQHPLVVLPRLLFSARTLFLCFCSLLNKPTVPNERHTPHGGSDKSTTRNFGDHLY